ncbi:MAG: winged helix-turn-helix domain-containing protein [Deinococcales bacterium]
MPKDAHLTEERKRLEQAWAAYTRDNLNPNISPEVMRSWQRSSQFVNPARPNVPVSDPLEISREWQDSLLYQAAKPIITDLEKVADEADFIVAICDGEGRLLWTHSSNYMQRRAEKLNFVPSGCWGETAAGTNALGLSLKLAKPSKVFSAEHYLQAAHDWVCYSAPLRDPSSGMPIGVLDFSSTWQKDNPLGLMTVSALAKLIEERLKELRAASKLGVVGVDRLEQYATCALYLCGRNEVYFEGQQLKLSPRQYEILTLLALHPQGLSLDELHAHLYGDKEISLSTLKAEISQLRQMLQGKISSRPYRLNLAYLCDALVIRDYLEEGKIDKAMSLYQGKLLALSDAPSLNEWRDFLDEAIKSAIILAHDIELMWLYNSRCPDDVEILLKLAAFLAPNDPRLTMVIARLKLLGFTA